jgi:predicted CoA-binding protein
MGLTQKKDAAHSVMQRLEIGGYQVVYLSPRPWNRLFF